MILRQKKRKKNQNLSVLIVKLNTQHLFSNLLALYSTEKTNSVSSASEWHMEVRRLSNFLTLIS